MKASTVSYTPTHHNSELASASVHIKEAWKISLQISFAKTNKTCLIKTMKALIGTLNTKKVLSYLFDKQFYVFLS